MGPDVSASTPSNAAQILVPDKTEIIRSSRLQIDNLLPRILQLVNQHEQTIQTILLNAIKTIDLSIDDKIRQVSNIKNILRQLDPSTVLKRGYAILRGDIGIGTLIEVETIKAILKAEVKDVKRK